MDVEEEFCNLHSDYGDSYFDEKYGLMREKGDDDFAIFLIEKLFAEYNECYSKVIANEEKYGLTKAEIVLLSMFNSKFSAEFWDDYYHGKTPEVVKQMFVGINNVVA